jgi:hypothetical protein
LVFCPTWGVYTGADHFRAEFKAERVMEYSRADALLMWKLHGYAGPWDEKVLAVVNAGRSA